MKRIKLRWRVLIGYVLFATLFFSVVYIVVELISAPVRQTHIPYEKMKSDYVLMLVQCLLGMLVVFLPTLIERRWKIEVPGYMSILYHVFLFGAVYLGEVRKFYYVVPHWDSFLHAMSGMMLGALGFWLVSLLNEHKKVKLNLSPFFMSAFAFCFALSAGAVWEIYEFLMDGMMKLNMQKFALEDGTLLLGRDALNDTMKDLIIDAVSALLMAVIGNFLIRRQSRGAAQTAFADGTGGMKPLPEDEAERA